MGAALPAEGTTYLCAQAVIAGSSVQQARIDVDGEGRTVLAGERSELVAQPLRSIVRDLGSVLVVPGFVNAHSHAFQRGIRGATHRRGAADPSSFWSWRKAMYRYANDLDPAALHHVTLLAFREMVRAGITCVGEFHYVHHQPDGTPYDDPNELSWQVVRAAQEAGIRLTLLEVYYSRSGTDAGPLPEQRRFCDGSVDAYLDRVRTLIDRGVPVGITPHSVRAVSRPELEALVEFANERELPIHIHVSEQPRENAECQAEHGFSPTRLLEAVGATQRERALTAVHAVHIDEEDRRILADQSVCACPTTEADLGDGVVIASEMRDRGTNVALGSDSNAVIDLVQEARLLEMDERLASQSRLRHNGPDGRLGARLLEAATLGGAISLHQPHGRISLGAKLDAASFDLRHPFFADVASEHRLDALLTAGTCAPVAHVIVDGIEIEHR